MLSCFHFAGVAVDSVQELAGKVSLFRPQMRLGRPGRQSIQGAICPTTHPQGRGDFIATLFVLSA